jgi:hypothetical protein
MHASKHATTAVCDLHSNQEAADVTGGGRGHQQACQMQIHVVLKKTRNKKGTKFFFSVDSLI